jgi:hypothetical protein
VVLFQGESPSDVFETEGLIARVIHGRRESDGEGLGFGVQLLGVGANDEEEFCDSGHGIRRSA